MGLNSLDSKTEVLYDTEDNDDEEEENTFGDASVL